MKNGIINDIKKNDYIVSEQTIWNRIRERAALQGVPIHGHFELTPQCNLDCKMCYVHLNKGQMNGCTELSFFEWKQIIDQAVKSGMIFASLSGGECFLSPYFEDIYLYLQSKGVFVTILTNGVLLGDKLDFFELYPPVYIQVSVYGKDEEAYEKVTGHKCFAKVKKNVDEAIEKRLNVGIAITTSKYLTDIDDIIKYYKEKNISVTVSQWLMPPYDSTERLLENFNLSSEEQVDIAKRIMYTIEGKKPTPYDGKIPAPGGDSNNQLIRGITCSAGRSDFSISWNGAMSLCVSLNTPVGYPLIEGFENVWKRAREIADNFLMPVECVECVYSKICKHCPAQHLISANPGHCSSVICEETQLMVRAGLIELDNKI